MDVTPPPNDVLIGRRLRRRVAITLEVVPVESVPGCATDRVILRDQRTGEALVAVSLAAIGHERELVEAFAYVLADALDAELL
jgi:hypothetical protein